MAERTRSGIFWNPLLSMPVMVALLLMPALPALADPCCVNQNCLDLDPAECVAQSGIQGLCDIGLACGAPGCDGTQIQPIAHVYGTKQDLDVHFGFRPDPLADTYYTAWVRDPRELLTCGISGRPVVGSYPSTIPEALHVDGVSGPAGDLLYYCVRGGCSTSTEPTGACCDKSNNCSDNQQATLCRAVGGVYHGDGSSCADHPCVADIRPCLLGGNVVYFNGDPGDWVHPGIDTIVNAVFTTSITPTTAPHTVHISVDPDDPGQGLWWDTDFSSRQRGEPLQPGLYEDAQREPFADPGHPGLNISGDGRGCNILSGRFAVWELELSGTALRSFTATWEQHCEAGASQLRGCVHYEQ
jgi:hypothetical protein